MIEFDKVKEVSVGGKQVSEIWQGDNLLWKKDPWVLIGELDWNDYNSSTGNWYDRVNGANWYAPYKNLLQKTDNGIKYTNSSYAGYSRLTENHKIKYNFGYNLRIVIDITTAPTISSTSSVRFFWLDFSSLCQAEKNLGLLIDSNPTTSTLNWKMLGNNSSANYGIRGNVNCNFQFKVNTNYVIEWRFTKKSSAYQDYDFFVNGNKTCHFDKIPNVEYNLNTMQKSGSNPNIMSFPQGVSGIQGSSTEQYRVPSGVIVRNIKFYKIP